MKKTILDEELSQMSLSIAIIDGNVDLVKSYIEEGDIINALQSLNTISGYLNSIHDFLLKYDDFFEVLDKKFGTNSMKCNESSKGIVTDMKRDIQQMVTFSSQRKMEICRQILENFYHEQKSLKKNLEVIFTLPNLIDYSKLSNKDWRMIGVAGIHYRSKVFLSYFFRDVNPKKDENQKMIDYYIKPTLELLNIKPVAARDHLKPQELIDARIMELIEECDGIIGFYTKEDSVENVEHELSGNDNVIAVCKEEGAKVPSMRLSKLLINFKRDEMGNFLMDLIRVLKDRKLFTTIV